jgi:hypothetical protein
MFEGGADLEIKEGTATDKQAKWYTIRQLNGADFRVNWTADLTDENTITLNREFPNGVPGGAVVAADVAAVAVLRAELLLQPVERPQRVVHPQQRPAQLRVAVPPVVVAADAAVVVVAGGGGAGPVTLHRAK